MEIKLVEWLKESPDNLALLRSALVNGAAEIEKFYRGGHGGNGLGIILHHCKPYMDGNSLWRELFQYLPKPIQLEFLFAIEQVLKPREVGKREYHGDFQQQDDGKDMFHSCVAVPNITALCSGVDQGIATDARKAVVTFLYIRRFRQSCLGILPRDIVRMIARLIWDSNLRSPAKYLKVPPGRVWLD